MKENGTTQISEKTACQFSKKKEPQLGCSPTRNPTPDLTHDQQRLILRLRHQIQLVIRVGVIHGRFRFGRGRRRWHGAARVGLVCAPPRRLRDALSLFARSVREKNTQRVCVRSDAKQKAIRPVHKRRRLRISHVPHLHVVF